MANAFNIPKVYTNEALACLHNNLVFTKRVNRQYDDQFANSKVTISGKIGPSLNIRLPNKFSVVKSAKLDVQDVTENSINLPISYQFQVAMAFSMFDETLTLDEKSKRYIQPAAKVLAAQLDAAAYSYCASRVANISNPGATGGLTTLSNVATTLQANTLLDNCSCPRDGKRYTILQPSAQGKLLAGMTGMFNAQNALGKQFETGEIETAYGDKFSMSQSVNSLTTGSRTTANTWVTNASNITNGTTQLALTSTSNSNTWVVGDRFTVAGIYMANSELKTSTGQLQQFVVTTGGTASSGAITLGILPTIYISGPQQNVVTTTGSQAVVPIGTASTSYGQNMVFHKDAFAVVTADLYVPDQTKGYRAMSDGVSMRVMEVYDVINDRLVTRMDVLFGYIELYPQWACIMAGDLA